MVPGPEDRTEIESFQMGGYASYNKNRSYIDGTFSLTRSDYDSSRFLSIGALTAAAHGRYDGTQAAAYIEGGRIYDLGSSTHIQDIDRTSCR